MPPSMLEINAQIALKDCCNTINTYLPQLTKALNRIATVLEEQNKKEESK